MEDFDVLGIIQGIREIFQEFHAGIFLGVAAICYLIIQVFRGKAGFKVPYVTAWFERRTKEVKTYIILGLFGLAGGLTALSGDISVWSIVDGILGGLAAGIGTIGARNVVKQGIEGVGTLKNKVKDPNQ